MATTIKPLPKTKNARVKRALDNIIKRVSVQIPTINYGGCGLFAAELVKRLKTNGIRSAGLRVYSFDDPGVNVSEAETFVRANNSQGDLNAWNANGVTFDHVRVEWNKRFWDGEFSESTDWRAIDPYETNGNMAIQSGEVSLESLEALLVDKWNWNSTFDRDMYLPKLKAIMDHCFMDAGLKTLAA